MRHYFRFMELEPVLELEEDSVGDESPTSSTGSPSFSPPPDVWGQLTGKEYHDSVYNLLLQDHLELQRAYRVLEVQYRNYEKRAGRDATESAAQVRALKDTLKEVLTTQESDRMIAIKEDLQRVRERETKLKEEAYDLREQNELLEFRILELEECQENSSRSGGYDTCDTATDTGDDDVTGTPSDGTHGEQVIADVSTLVTPDSTLTIRNEPSDVTPHIGEVTCHQATLHNNVDENMCQQTLESNMASPPGDPQYSTVTAQSAVNLEQSSPHVHHNDDRDQMSAAECSSGGVPTCPPDVSACQPISCTLCRRLPRRKSLTDTSTTDVSGELQREPLRKCKSDGEIKKWNRCRELEFRDDMEFEVANCSEYREIVNLSNKHKSKSRNVENSSVSCSPNNQFDGMPLNSSEVTHSCDSSNASNRSTSNEDDQSVMKDMLKSIWDVLKETRIEVECTNSELREEVVTLENTVVCLMGETTASQDAAEEETKDNAPGNLRQLFQRHNSLTSSKECHCCSEAMRPAIEDVICKLQLLTYMVDNASPKPITTSRTPCAEAKTADAWDNSVTDGKTEALKTPHVETPETHVVRTEVQIRKSISDEGENKLMSRVTEHDERNNIVENSVGNEDEHAVIEYKDNITIVRNIVEKKREYFKSSKAVFEMDNRTEYHASALHPKVAESYNVGDAERPNKEFNNNILIEVPLSGDTKQKPVLRRWMEHLNDRQVRAKSWGGVDLTCPNQLQPTSVK